MLFYILFFSASWGKGAYQNCFIRSFTFNSYAYAGGIDITEIMDKAKFMLNILGATFLIPGLVMLFLGGNFFIFGAAMALIGVGLFWIPHTHSKDKIDRD